MLVDSLPGLKMALNQTYNGNRTIHMKFIMNINYDFARNLSYQIYLYCIIYIYQLL
jgi:hypothetical protein